MSNQKGNTTHRTSIVEKRKRKLKADKSNKNMVSKKEPNTWKDVHELINTLDEMLRNTAASVLSIHNSPELAAKKATSDADFTVNVDSLVTEAAQRIAVLKDALRVLVPDIPQDPNTEVSEEVYPRYLEIYSQLVLTHSSITEDLIPILARITEIVLDINDDAEDTVSEVSVSTETADEVEVVA